MEITYQKDYRKKQRASGLVRYELQIPKILKENIELMASEAAEEYATPRSLKQRMSKARAEVLVRTVNPPIM